MPKVYSYFKSNLKEPNLIVNNIGTFDLTATFAKIEMNYGSKTECSPEEALKRRAAKERLKLRCVYFVYSAQDLEEEDFNQERSDLDIWLVPKISDYDVPFKTVFSENKD